MAWYGRDYERYGFRGDTGRNRGAGYGRDFRWNGPDRGGAERIAFGPYGHGFRGDRAFGGPARPGWHEPRRGMRDTPYDRSYEQIHRGRSGHRDGTYDRADRFGRPYGG